MKEYYTEKQYKELLHHMIILHDTKEQKNEHILQYFDDMGIHHKARALKTGDYTLMLEADPSFGIYRDIWFSDMLVIERKNSIEELANNIADSGGTARFAREMSRFKDIKDVHIVIENDRIDDIIEHHYRSQLNADSFLRTMLTWQRKSNFYLNFVQKENMGKFIYELCKNCLDHTILK